MPCHFHRSYLNIVQNVPIPYQLGCAPSVFHRFRSPIVFSCSNDFDFEVIVPSLHPWRLRVETNSKFLTHPRFRRSVRQRNNEKPGVLLEAAARVLIGYKWESSARKPKASTNKRRAVGIARKAVGEQTTYTKHYGVVVCNQQSPECRLSFDRRCRFTDELRRQ